MAAFAFATAASLGACGGDPPSPPAAPGIRFEECAEKAGLRFRTHFIPAEQGENFRINLYDHGSGVAVADVDGDGRDDVYLLDQLGANALFRNRGDGTFEDVTAAAGVGVGDRICVAAAFGDADGDGDPDLYVTTVRAGNLFFRNEGGGRFRDATREAGLELVTESLGAAFFDADGDGDLDLLVTNTARWTLDQFHERDRYWRGKASVPELLASETLRNVFYRNDGKGRFADATEESGLAGKGWGGDAAIFDMEGDGDLDVYVCNMFGTNHLFRNDGKGRFADATREALGRTSWGGMGARAFDYDGDALLDLLVVDMHSDMWLDSETGPESIEPAMRYPTFLARFVALGRVPESQDREFVVLAGIRREEVVFGNTLFRNKGGGAFEEVSGPAGAETFWPWGIAEGDFDADGHVDAFLPAGMGFPFFYWPPSLLRNRGDGTFEDRAAAAGLDPPPGGRETGQVFRGKKATRSGRAAATLDFDGDGRLDVVVNNFNDRVHLWRNVSAPGRWCGLRLRATRTEASAVGAVVRLTAGGRTQVRQVQAAGGYLSQSTTDLHFGLGAAANVERVEIRWPGGRVQVVEGVPAGKRTLILEPGE